MVLFGYLWLALMYLCLLLLMISGRGSWAASIARIPQLRSLGQLAYGVYLFHQPVAGTLHALILHRSPAIANGAQLGVTFLSLAVTLVIAKVSWTFFEKRFVDWGHRHRYESAPCKDARAADGGSGEQVVMLACDFHRHGLGTPAVLLWLRLAHQVQPAAEPITVGARYPWMRDPPMTQVG